MQDAACGLRRIYLPRTPVNKGYASRRMRCGVACLQPGLYATRYEKRVEALKPVPQLGTYGADGASGATGYLTKRKEVACCETRFVGPFGYVSTPEMAWVLDQGYANFGEHSFYALR